MPLAADDIARLYRSHAPGLLRYFARRTLQAEVAVDLVAESFAAAFADREHFRGDADADAAAWLYGIARHQLGKYFRRGVVERRALARLGLEREAMTEADFERVEELCGLPAQRQAIERGLAGMSKPQRDALALRIVEERSYSDVARLLGISEQTARARVSRALRALAKSTERLEGRPEVAA
ncbi:MAG TPA: RNA polymerase sigma factor [Solirubrobacteraceae bacterium]|nr:RNA polymerase sigma factor [Solirubrobacteraceae bacterium]